MADRPIADYPRDAVTADPMIPHPSPTPGNPP